MTAQTLAALYPVAISFTRHFHKGWMNGVSASDVLRFVDRDSAARWLRGIRANAKAGAINYTITLA